MSVFDSTLFNDHERHHDKNNNVAFVSCVFTGDTNHIVGFDVLWYISQISSLYVTRTSIFIIET